MNVLAQAAVLAFSLTSLAQHVDEMPLALAIVTEVGGLLALLAATVASGRASEVLFQIALAAPEHEDDPYEGEPVVEEDHPREGEPVVE